MTGIKNGSSDYSAARSASSSRLATASDNVVVGLDDDLLAIKKQLCGQSSRLQIIPIVGMGGIGKTTLARKAYHDPLIRDVFHIGGWVTVSQSYNPDDILSRLHQSLQPFDAKRVEESHEEDVSEQETDESEGEFYEENDEQGNNGTESPDVEEKPESPADLFRQSPESKGDQVYKTLKGRKYVIVMDDIWNSEVCDHLNRVFPDDDNGSRIILTTRLHDVATYAKDYSPHELQLLPEKESWNLLRHKVFPNGVCNHELENIGMSIARSCGGLPLAIVVIAGLLATVEKTQASWEVIAEKVNSTIAARDGQFEKILSLSYTHLPHHLRQCFVYMGGFPEDREIHVAKLIKLWVAEGFVGAIPASKSLEEEAEECLQDLVKRSLVLVGTRKPGGEIKSCGLHDLMRDLCVRKADEEKFPLHDMDAGRTLVERYKEGSFEDVRHLRVMEIEKGVLYPSSAGVELCFWVPEQIFRLSKLRYLALAYFVEIPTALSYLENLQTLIIYATEGLVVLPQQIWTMPQLRHLISSFDQLPYPEGEASSLSLENLQTLYEVSNLKCTDKFMAMIPNIKKLGLFYSAGYGFEQAHHLDNYRCLQQLEKKFKHAPYFDYHLENLECLHQLEKLKVRVHPGFQGIINPVFPVSLKKLSLSGWRFPSWKDMTVVGSLPNLQVLKLRDSGGQDGTWETTEGEFARLSYLLIERSDLREWITEPEHFPNLKQLRLHYCSCLDEIRSCLDEIPAGIGYISTLELIEVKEGSTFLVEWAKGIEEERQIMGNDCLQIRCTNSLHFSYGGGLLPVEDVHAKTKLSRGSLEQYNSYQLGYEIDSLVTGLFVFLLYIQFLCCTF